MSYFKNFPQIDYYFGNKVRPVAFTNLNVYVDILDQVKDDVASYTYYNIQDGDRPDQVSHDLYGTTDYYWTFYLLNDDIRLHGWPLSSREVEEKAKYDYSHDVIVTSSNLSNVFKKGTTFRGLTSGATGLVQEKRLDLNQLIYDKTSTADFIAGEVLLDADNNQIIKTSTTKEYNATHHFENAAGEYFNVNSLFADVVSTQTKFLLYNTSTTAYNLDDIYDTQSLANAAKGLNEEVREVKLYRLVNTDGDRIANTIIGLYYYNTGAAEYQLYHNITAYESAGSITDGVSTFDATDTFTTEKAAQDFYTTEFDDYITENFNTVAPSILTPVTFLERVKEENDRKLQLKVIKPSVIEDVIDAFNSIILDTEAEEPVVAVSSGQQGLGSYTSTTVSS
jgi:hypothetical protein